MELLIELPYFPELGFSIKDFYELDWQREVVTPQKTLCEEFLEDWKEDTLKPLLVFHQEKCTIRYTEDDGFEQIEILFDHKCDWALELIEECFSEYIELYDFAEGYKNEWELKGNILKSKYRWLPD